jgi:peptide/nickel transport system permease protein
VVRGDFGISLYERRPAARVAAEALPATLLLAATALVCEAGGGLLLGVAAARRRGSAADQVLRITSLVLYSQPTFWLGLMAILVFSYLWPVLPASHMHSVGAEQMGRWGRLLDLGRHLALPALVMGVSEAGGRARFVRASLIEAMSGDHIRTARAKGLSERRVVWVHGLRTAVIPLVQLSGISLPLLLSGALIVEVIFSWPGLGRLTFGAILTRDYPLVLCTTAFAGAMVVAGSLAADLALAALDPRVRTPEGGMRMG